MPSLLQKSQKVLNGNSRKKDGHFYTVPSPETYPYQWLWDSCFHSLVYRHFDVKKAKEELYSLISKQLPNGLIPHMIYWEKAKPFGNLLTEISWGGKGTSTITQPPIIADAVLKIYDKEKDEEFLEKIYPSLKNYYKYLLSDRDIRSRHLIGIINPDESGEDNSPRFDIPLRLPVIQTEEQSLKARMALVVQNKQCKFNCQDCMKNFFWVKDLPFNCLAYKNLISLSKIASILKNKEDAKFFETQAELLKKAMKQYLFEDGLYWSVYQPADFSDYKKIKTLTWAIFAPLYAEILTQKEAGDLVDDYLLDPRRFWLHYPVPTVALSEPSFDPDGFWRGPTWMNTNWFIFQGLLSYGFRDIAREIFKVSKFLVEKQGFREQYNPITGQGLGAKNFTWGTLVLDMEKSLK